MSDHCGKPTLETKQASIYRLVDDDFIEDLTVYADIYSGNVDTVSPVIAAYERRNLPIAPNVFKMLLTRPGIKSGYYDIKTLIGYLATTNSTFFHYKDDIEKYLLLL